MIAKIRKSTIEKIKAATTFNKLPHEEIDLFFGDDSYGSIQCPPNYTGCLDCTVKGYDGSVYFEEQPSCCANVMLHDFSAEKSDRSWEALATLKVLFLTAIHLGKQQERVNLWFTHHREGPWAEVALELGFKIEREYQSKTTYNNLADFYYTL